jgi:hypothetical protein
MRQLRSHLTYGNVIGTIALFLVLSGGTAVALSGSNTVFSDDIVDGQVRKNDLANSAGKIYGNRIVIPAGSTGGETVLNVPGFGRLEVWGCGDNPLNHATATRWHNTTKTSEEVFWGQDQQVAPNQYAGPIGGEARWQIGRGTGTATELATIEQTTTHPYLNTARCSFMAQGTTQRP